MVSRPKYWRELPRHFEPRPNTRMVLEITTTSRRIFPFSIRMLKARHEKRKSFGEKKNAGTHIILIIFFTSLLRWQYLTKPMKIRLLRTKNALIRDTVCNTSFSFMVHLRHMTLNGERTFTTHTPHTTASTIPTASSTFPTRSLVLSDSRNIRQALAARRHYPDSATSGKLISVGGVKASKMYSAVNTRNSAGSRRCFRLRTLDHRKTLYKNLYVKSQQHTVALELECTAD